MRLEGGQGGTWRSGNVVLKPMFDPQGAIWEAETFVSLPKVGYRVAEPVRGSDGHWVREGWTASRFVEGVCPKGTHLPERFAASRRLHADLAGVKRPSHLEQAKDPWYRAQRIAFGFEEWVPDVRIASCLAHFRRLQEPVGDAWQVIHGDLAGNFLVMEGAPPAIIDFTPKWSPCGFGEAVMAVDVCLWEEPPWDEVASLLLPAEHRLVALAAARRLLEIDTHHRMRQQSDAVFEQVALYEELAGRIAVTTSG